MRSLEVSLLSLLLLGICQGLHLFGGGIVRVALLHKSQHSPFRPLDSGNDRRKIISYVGSAVIAMGSLPQRSDAKSYSANARNLERMNTGDMSGGSLYDNNPTTTSGQRRRAMTGCKSAIAREEAAEAILGVQSLSEKECNQKVLEGSSEVILQSLRNLDCPSCPYGIATSRKQL